MRAWLLALPLPVLLAASQPAPEVVRLYPLGGQAGSTVTLEILGERLSNVKSVQFDCRDLIWKHTTASSPSKVTGQVEIAAGAALGPHLLHVDTLDGPSTSAIFNVGQFRSDPEVEPNDLQAKAQRIASLPVEVQGRLDGAADIDLFAVDLRQGERWLFDLRAIEEGSAVEARMIVMDSAGREVSFNDDRDDYNENPRLEFRAPQTGSYYIKLDQYRGPRGFNFGKNCAYTLRLSQLPVVFTASPVVLQRGVATALRIQGSALEAAERIYLTEVRGAEYARMTYPHTMPIAFRPDPPMGTLVARIEGRVRRRTATSLDALVTVPATTRQGLWRVWVSGKNGVTEGMHLEITGRPVIPEIRAARLAEQGPAIVVTGALDQPGQRDIYRVQGRAGQPLHFSTLAAQLGVPLIDTVLTLRDAAGKKLAENDDVVAGQGSLLGNPDSALFYTPGQDGPLTLEVTDRTRRGGNGFEYSLKIDVDRPSFQLFTTPENLTASRGEVANLKVHMVREQGFTDEVDIWMEGLPPGVEAPRAQFRRDQLFEPNADGADMIIPEITFSIKIPGGLTAGAYPFRVYGAPHTAPQQRVEAGAVVMIGPLLDLWNFTRRPLPSVKLHVVEPFEPTLLTENRSLRLQPGKTATLEFKAEKLPERAPLKLIDLPADVSYRVVGRQGSQITVLLEAGMAAAAGSYEIAAEAEVGSRRAASRSIVLSIQASTP